jgi:hypothetical protein
VDVPVIPAAALPKAVMDIPIGLLVAKPFQECGRMLAEIGQCRPLHRVFQGRPDKANLINRVIGPQDDVDMFRHYHVGPKQKIATPAGQVEGFDTPLSGLVLSQKG